MCTYKGSIIFESDTRNCPLIVSWKGMGNWVSEVEFLLNIFVPFKVFTIWIGYQFKQINKLNLTILLLL